MIEMVSEAMKQNEPEIQGQVSQSMTLIASTMANNL